MKRHRKIGVFLYNRLFDPLIQSNFWPFIVQYLQEDENNRIKIYVISYEDKNYALSPQQEQQLISWKEKGLIWYRLQWNPGNGIWPKTKDIIKGFFAICFLRVRGCKHFLSVASVAGSFLGFYHTFLKYDFFIYSFEPHSAYALDNKMWKRESFQYRIASFLERKSAVSAKVITSGTQFMEKMLLEEWKITGKFFKIPSVASETKFDFSQKDRHLIRNKLGFGGQTKVLFYPGKFGDLYYKEEIALMFKWLLELDSNFHFLIITPQDIASVKTLFEGASINPSAYTILQSEYSEIHRYYSSADFGIVAVPPGPSKKFISNIKVGEYLLAGLPFLITEGVSEDYLYAIEKKVGVVVKEFSEDHIKNAYPEINDFLKMNRDELRKHCREIGLNYRGFTRLNEQFKKAFEYLYTPFEKDERHSNL
jgi:hypothetical protein